MVIWCAQVGKKKTQDVQFYTEVMEVNQAIDAGRRSMYDPDELEEEQRERGHPQPGALSSAAQDNSSATLPRSLSICWSTW